MRANKGQRWKEREGEKEKRLVHLAKQPKKKAPRTMKTEGPSDRPGVSKFSSFQLPVLALASQHAGTVCATAAGQSLQSVLCPGAHTDFP